jgi:hypothetical protein
MAAWKQAAIYFPLCNLFTSLLIPKYFLEFILLEIITKRFLASPISQA